MSTSMSYEEFFKDVVSIGGAVASAWSEGAKKYAEQVTKLAKETGQAALSAQQHYAVISHFSDHFSESAKSLPLINPGSMVGGYNDA